MNTDSEAPNQPVDGDSDVFYAHSYQTADGKYVCELRKLDETPVCGFAGYDSEVEAEIAAMQWYMHYMSTKEW